MTYRFRLQAVLRGGGGGHAERDVPGGAGHRQRPLLGALRLQAVRVHRQRHRAARDGAPPLQPAGVVDEQAGDVRQRAVRPSQRLLRRHQRQLPVRGPVPVGQHLHLRGAGAGRAPPHPGAPRRRRRGRGSPAGARRVRVRAGADGHVPGRRRLRRPDGARQGERVRAQRARLKRPRRVRQLLHVLRRRRRRPHQLRRLRQQRPGRDALHRPENAVQRELHGRQRRDQVGGGGVRRRHRLWHVLHLPRRPGVHGARHQCESLSLYIIYARRMLVSIVQ